MAVGGNHPGMPHHEPARTIDVREIPRGERHPTILETYEALGPGESMRLIVDHDPVPLRKQMGNRFGDELSWVYVEQGPDTWQVEVQRLTDD